MLLVEELVELFRAQYLCIQIREDGRYQIVLVVLDNALEAVFQGVNERHIGGLELVFHLLPLFRTLVHVFLGQVVQSHNLIAYSLVGFRQACVELRTLQLFRVEIHRHGLAVVEERDVPRVITAL